MSVKGNEPVPNYGLADDFPKLWKLAQAYDFASRLGVVGGTLEQEADRALRELWDARRSVSREAGGGA